MGIVIVVGQMGTMLSLIPSWIRSVKFLATWSWIGVVGGCCN
jgi:hypothetical protein